LREHKVRYLTFKKVEEITEKNKIRRLAYAQEMRGYERNKVFFSDEKTFPVGAEKTHGWQEPGKRRTHTFRRHPPKINVWAAAGTWMKSQLYFFKGTMKAPLYGKMIKNRLQEKRITYSPDCPADIPENWVPMQDNDPKHTAYKTLALLDDLVEDKIVDPPSQSPDLNVMDIRSHLDRAVKAVKIKTVAGLKRKLTMEWEKLKWSVIRTSVHTQCRPGWPSASN
jgi:hypothetical protein